MISAWIRRTGCSRTASAESRWTDVVQQARQALAAGDIAQAKALLEQALADGCASAEVRRLLGSVLGASGDLERAREELERVLQTDPGDAAALSDLGNIHRIRGFAAEAESCYRRALSHNPKNRTARFNLAQLDDEAGRTELALQALRSLVEFPASPEAVKALAGLLDRTGRAQEAMRACSDILEQEPEHAVAHACLGMLLLKRELQPQRALEHFQRAIALGYAAADLWSNRGIALQDLGRLEEAVASYDRALQIEPGHRLAAFHRSLALLMQGDFERAWSDYELRLLSEDLPKPPRTFAVWDGEPLPEDALFVYGEQGIGDEIMFASCLPDLMALQTKVVVACTAKLEPIFRRSFPGASVMTLQHAAEAAADPHFGPVRAMTAIGSLPRRFRPSPASFPKHSGYLQADARLVEGYCDRLSALGPMPKVGISWRGGSAETRRALRTLPVAELRDLLSVRDVQFIDLQYDSGESEEGIEEALTQGKLVHWQDALQDYERTAALVCALDLVVSVCTAVIHLAGALGRPAWVMTPFSPEWRYGAEGSTMPWYPSVRLERQPVAGDWHSVIRVVKARLEALPWHNLRHGGPSVMRG
jgi:tetratricopeptide (TPR) repeat protein